MRLRDNAKRLRREQTDAESRLWYHLRAHRFLRLKFKRQKPLGQYIVDFVCHEQALVIEIDGGQHAERAAYDRTRDEWLRAEGYTVLRFWNVDVMQQLDGVLERIREEVLSRPLPRPLSRTRERGATHLSPGPLPQAGEGSDAPSLPKRK